MADISKLYKEVILKHNETPIHYEKMEDADQVIEAYNPLCGDSFKVYLKLDNSIIQKASFHGYGCAISKASTSILVRDIEGQSVEKAHELCAQFFSYVLPGQTPKAPLNPDFQAFEAAKQFPGRLKCATLSWDAFKETMD